MRFLILILPVFWTKIFFTIQHINKVINLTLSHRILNNSFRQFYGKEISQNLPKQLNYFVGSL